MSGDFGNHDPPHNSVLCSYRLLGVTDWSFKPFVLTVDVFHSLPASTFVFFDFYYNNVFRECFDICPRTATAFFLPFPVIVFAPMLFVEPHHAHIVTRDVTCKCGRRVMSETPVIIILIRLPVRIKVNHGWRGAQISLSPSWYRQRLCPHTLTVRSLSAPCATT